MMPLPSLSIMTVVAASVAEALTLLPTFLQMGFEHLIPLVHH
jgi:hypothetical protein